MPRPDLLERLAVQTAERERASLRRRLRAIDHADGPWLESGSRRLLSFCSNDYLGMAQHPQLVGALTRAAREEGVGSTSAHLICGHRREHAELEEALAAWTGRERALLFSTGYMANLGVLQALLARGDVCVQDKLNHACLLDGARLSGAELKRYPHADVAAAARQLPARPDAAVLLATDGVFSMDGDLADLPALCATARRKGAWVMVDDAHGFGPLGATGGGIVEHFGLGLDDVPVLVGTLGKAFGTAGAFVVGSEELIETLIQFARPYIYTTSQPPAVACATLKSLELLRSEHWRRAHLDTLIARFRAGAKAIGLRLVDSPTPIQPILIGGSRQAMALAAELRERGILVGAIRPPTVPAGTARLRVTLSALHSEAQVDRLLAALAEGWQRVSSGLLAEIDAEEGDDA